MTAEELWSAYVGEETPEAFLRRLGSRDLEACVHKHVAQLPQMFGIVLCSSWRTTFTAEEQLTRERVRCGLAAYLEDTRASWEAAVADLPESLRGAGQACDEPPAQAKIPPAAEQDAHSPPQPAGEAESPPAPEPRQHEAPDCNPHDPPEEPPQ